MPDGASSVGVSVGGVGLAAPDAPATNAEREQRFTLVALLAGHPGALERVMGVLRRRGTGQMELNVASSETGGALRLTAHLGSAAPQLAEHLRKLVDVAWVEAFPTSEAGDAPLVREFALARVASAPETRREIVAIAQLCGAHVVDVGADSLTLEASGPPETISNLFELLRPYGVQAALRTGRMALERVRDAFPTPSVEEGAAHNDE